MLQEETKTASQRLDLKSWCSLNYIPAFLKLQIFIFSPSRLGSGAIWQSFLYSSWDQEFGV